MIDRMLLMGVWWQSVCNTAGGEDAADRNEVPYRVEAALPGWQRVDTKCDYVRIWGIM